MTFKSFLKQSSVAAFLISQASASQLSITTQLWGDITDPSNAKLIMSILPLNLTIQVLDTANPTMPPLWSWNDRNFGFNGNKASINSGVTTELTADLPPLTIGQLVFSLSFPASTKIPPMNGVYQCGTQNPLSMINFAFNTMDADVNFNNYAFSASIIGNQNELYMYEFRTFYAPTPLNQFQTYPYMPTGDSLNQESRSAPKETASDKVLTINAKLTPDFVKVLLKSGFNPTNFPVQFTVANPQSSGQNLFQETVILGKDQGNNSYFCLGYASPWVFSVDLPALEKNTLSASFQNPSLSAVYWAGTNTPLQSISFTTMNGFWPVVYPNGMFYNAVSIMTDPYQPLISMGQDRPANKAKESDQKASEKPLDLEKAALDFKNYTPKKSWFF